MFDESLLKSFFSLIALVGVLGIALFIVKRISKKSRSKQNGMELSILSRTSIQPKSHLYIVQAGVKTLLLGVSDHNINTLADLTEEKNKPSFNTPKTTPAVKTNLPQITIPLISTNTKGNPLSFRNFLSTIVKNGK